MYLDNLTSLFITKHGSSQTTIKKRLLFLILGIILAIIFLYTRKISVAPIIAVMIFILIIADSFASVSETLIDDVNSDTMTRLNAIQDKINEYINLEIIKNNQNNVFTKEYIIFLQSKNQMDSLYMDAKIIHLFFDLLPLYTYSPTQYYKLVKGANNILKLRRDIEYYYKENNIYPDNIFQMLKSAMKLRTNTMNNIHNFIYSIPKQEEFYDYLTLVAKKYDSLIEYNIVKISKAHDSFNKAHGVDINTKFIDIHAPKGYNTVNNHKYYT